MYKLNTNVGQVKLYDNNRYCRSLVTISLYLFHFLCSYTLAAEGWRYLSLITWLCDFEKFGSYSNFPKIIRIKWVKRKMRIVLENFAPALGVGTRSRVVFCDFPSISLFILRTFYSVWFPVISRLNYGVSYCFFFSRYIF